MNRRIIDISQTLSARVPVWPGDPNVEIATLSSAGDTRLSAEDPASGVSRLTLSTHAGTHVDPPAHFIAGAGTVEHLPLDVLIGPAWVAHIGGPGPISAAMLDAARLPASTARLLLRTENSDRPHDAFDPGFVALTADAAGWLLERGVRLIGVDGPSVEPYVAPGHPVHRTLLPQSVILLEGLVLKGVAEGAYELICLPLSIAAGDGAPARAVLVQEVE
jgi:arylformamidase